VFLYNNTLVYAMQMSDAQHVCTDDRIRMYNNTLVYAMQMSDAQHVCTDDRIRMHGFNRVIHAACPLEA